MDFRRLIPDLAMVLVRPKQVLQRAREPVEYVYSPNGGVYSLVTMMMDGTMVEATTIGDEGMFCIESLFHEDATAPGECILQVPDGDITRLSIASFRRELERRGALYDLAGRYAQVAVAQIMQSVACNALHHLRQRCARWLLLTHDRVHRDDFRLSHELLAVMLGAQRPTVTVVAGTLQKAGLIDYTYGHVTVLNRRGLEAAACPCYALIRQQFERLEV